MMLRKKWRGRKTYQTPYGPCNDRQFTCNLGAETVSMLDKTSYYLNLKKKQIITQAIRYVSNNIEEFKEFIGHTQLDGVAYIRTYNLPTSVVEQIEKLSDELGLTKSATVELALKFYIPKLKGGSRY